MLLTTVLDWNDTSLHRGVNRLDHIPLVLHSKNQEEIDIQTVLGQLTQTNFLSSFYPPLFKKAGSPSLFQFHS